MLAVEVPVSQPVYAPAPGNQYAAAAAGNGDQYLVVWADERAGVQQVYATRISGDGTVLDPNGIRVASGALTYYPSVIWGGSSWFVVSNNCLGIELVRVDRSGVVLDARPRVLPADGWCPGVSLATDGRHVVVGYVSGYSAYEHHALFLDQDGELIADVQLSAAEYDNSGPAIAWDGSSFVAVWGSSAVRFDRNGKLGPARNVAIGGSPSGKLHIVWDGASFLVTRGDLAFQMSTDLFARRFAAAPSSRVQSIHWTGSSYAIVAVVPYYDNGHENTGRISILLLDRDGRVLGQREVQTVEGYGARPVVAANSRNLLVAWDDPTEARDVTWRDHDTYAALVSLPDLEPEPRQLLSVAAHSQRRPSMAVGINNQLTVWQESTGIYARRHWRDGTTDVSPLRLNTEAFSSSTAAVFDGSDYIVASTEGASVVFRRLPASGPLRVDREARTAGGNRPDSVALARDGAVTLAAWFDNGIYAARISTDGSLIDTVPLEVAPATLALATHRIAISPNRRGELLVVWGGSFPDCPCSPPRLAEGSVLRAARVSSTLTLLDRPPIDIAIPVGPYSSVSDPQSPRYDPQHSLFADHPSVTWNGNEWLVVWNRGFREPAAEGWNNREEIRGRRIARDGTLLDGSPRDPGVLLARDAFTPTVAWTGSSYLLAWYEGTPNYRGAYFHERVLQRLRTGSFDRAGALLSNQRTIGEAEESPVSIEISSGFISIAYARLGEDSRYGGVSRVFLDRIGVSNPRRRAAAS